jgi:ribosomal protein S18 acetylase RimI-like enzyme
VSTSKSEGAASIALRPATDDDRELLLDVYASTRADELAPVPWTAEQKRAFLRQQFDAQDRWWRLQYPDCSFQVIEIDGRAAGRLYVDRRPSEIRLVDIALLPELRGRGAGTRLIVALQREAEASGRTLTIHVERFNPARALYDRLGFREIGEAGDVYRLLEWRPVS